MSSVAQHVIIHGRVQGVGYRAWVRKEAEKVHLKGWVRNRSDGTVEAVFIGEDVTVQQLVSQCHVGPMMAKVARVESMPWTGELTDDFQVLKTAN